jgi:hypothetical protein
MFSQLIYSFRGRQRGSVVEDYLMPIYGVLCKKHMLKRFILRGVKSSLEVKQWSLSDD